jgi:hypothetical protein
VPSDREIRTAPLPIRGTDHPDHWQGIIHHFSSTLNNGVREGIHHNIQLAKRRARGYRNPGNFHHMIHFIAGDLRFDHPLFTT